MNTPSMGTGPLKRNGAADDPWLLNNVTAQGRHGCYEIIAANMFASGGEAQIYKAKRLSDGKLLIAKVYIAGAGNQRKNAERRDLRNWLLAIEDPASHGLLPLLDILMIQNDDGYTADVDIMPLCEGGNLTAANFEQLRKTIVPGLIKALHYLHENGWVHRDLKPDNIYIFEGKAVLGDFGITARISSDHTATNHTEAKRGTVGYTAREVRSGYYMPASDFFSLGCTIATLYNQGKHVYAKAVDAENDAMFHNQLMQNGLPLNCPSGEESIQTLVDALTLDDENIRAGYDDVRQWLDNPDAFTKKWKSCRQGMKPAFRMRFKEQEYYSQKDLTEAFLQNWEEALDFFYEDDMFVNYIKANGLAGCNTVGRILRNPPVTKLDKESRFAEFLHYFNRLSESVNPPIYWRTRKYSSLSEIAAAINTGERGIRADILDLLKSGFLSLKLKTTAPDDAKTLETVKRIETYAVEQPYLALETFPLLLSGFAAQEGRTTEQIVSGILSNKDILCELCALYPTKNVNPNVMTDVFNAVFAPLIQTGNSANVFELANKLDEEPNQVKRTIVVYLTFETICADKKFVRRHFYERGPYAHLYWLKKNIDLYDISSAEVQNIASKIRGVAFNDTTPIGDQLSRFMPLDAWHDEFYRNFQNSLFNTALGNMGGKTVKAKALDAFYLICDKTMVNYNLLSAQSIPIGHLRTLSYLPNKSLVENAITEVLDHAASTMQNASDGSVQATLNRISGGLSWLFEIYCKNRFSKGDVVQFAVDTVNAAKSGASQLGKVMARTTSPAYFHMYLYNMIDSCLQTLPEKSLLKKWDELCSQYKSAFQGEYDRLLQARAVSYDILEQRCPDDYRPIWSALKEKTAGFDVHRLFDRAGTLRDARDSFERAKKQFDSAVSQIQAKKVSKIESKDFTRIIRCAEGSQAAWEKLKNAFDSYNQIILPEFERAKSKAGADASALQFTWNRYIASIDDYKNTDYLQQMKYWMSEKWEAEGLCKYCGGKLSLFGKCKSCKRNVP